MPESYWYLATPYSKYPDGLEAAFVVAGRAVAHVHHLTARKLFSSIAHRHGIAKFGGFDPLDDQFWLSFDRPQMEAAQGLVVVKMKGWQDDDAIAVTIDQFESMCKPVQYVEWAVG